MGKEFDEEGEAINNVEATLRKYGITIRDTEGQFRDFGEVLDEINAKWETFSNTQQADIVAQMAGVRQRENLLILMERYNRYKEIEVEMTNSAGLAQERYGIYLDSVEAKTNKLKATWEAFWLTSFNSEAIKKVLDMATAVVQFGTNLGGLGDVLKIVIGLFLTFDAANIAGLFADIGKQVKSTITAMKGLAVATAEVTKAQLTLQAALGWVGLAMIIGEAVYQVIKYVGWINSAEKAQEDLNAATEKFAQAQADLDTEIRNREDLTELLKEYEELSNKAAKTADETERWYEVNRQIHDILPDISGYYDDSGRFIVDSKLTLQDILDLENKILEAKYKQYELDRLTRIDEQRQYVAKLQEEYNKLLAKREDLYKIPTLDERPDTLVEWLNQIELKFRIATSGVLLNKEGMEELDKQIQSLGLTLQQEQAILSLLTGEVVDLGDNTEETTTTINNLRNALNAIANSMQGESREGFIEFSRSILSLNDAFEEGEISAKAYFETLAEKADNADLIALFEGNTEAAQTFFEALFIEGLQAIDLLDTRMQEGKISILEYMDGLQGTGDVLREQYESLLENADAYGLNAEQIANITASYEEMTIALSSSNQELDNMRNTAELLFAGYDAIMTGTMKPASEEMISYYQQLSQAAWDYAQQSGFAFKDSEGQALTSAKAIYDYLSGGIGNFSNFASQMTERTNLAVQQQKQAIQSVIQSLAEIIGSFEVNLEAYSDGYTTINFPLPKIIGNTFKVGSFPIQIPNIKMEGGASFSQAAVDTLVSTLPDLIGGGGEFTIPAFDNDIWSGGGGYTPPPVNGGGGGGGGGSQEDEARNEAEKAYQDLLKMTIAMLKDRAKQAINALREELKAYKDLINQKKEDLNLMKEQRKEQNKIDEARENITSLEEEIAQLQFDTSEEGIARRLELEEQLAEERRALEDEQFGQSIDAQIRALDEEYENYEDYINAQIELLEDYLEREGEITQEAMELIHGRTEEFYNELMEWNMTYGSGVAQDVVDAWQGAIVWIDTFAMQGASAVEGFASRAGAAVSGMGSAVAAAAANAEASMATATQNMGRAIDATFAKLNSLLSGFVSIPTSQFGNFNTNIPLPYHSGGIVGGMPTLPESEVFAKLLKGEYVATEGDMYNFVNKTLPMIAGAGASNSKSIGEINIIFDVENMDREVLPDIKNMVTKAINDTLVDAGFKRNPGSFGSI